ncbi:MAG: hypothetical protein ACI4W2_04740 [Eubacterium sp.]
MKKKMVMVLTSLAMAAVITACGSSTSSTSSAASTTASSTASSAASSVTSSVASTAESTAASTAQAAESTATAQYATMDAFNQVQNGMTLDEVNKIFGFEGTKQASGSAAAAGLSSTAEVYMWAGETPGSAASISFLDGKVASMAQVGLQ